MNETILDHPHSDEDIHFIKGKMHFSSSARIAGYIFMTTGVAAVMHSVIFSFSIFQITIALLVFLLGLIVVTTRDGFLLNAKKGNYKQCIFFLGKAYGVWVSLPEIELVRATPIGQVYPATTIRPLGKAFSENIYLVVLYVKNSGRGIIVSSYAQTEAVRVAHQLGAILNVSVEVIG